MGKSAPAYLPIAVLVAAAAAISQFPSSTATSDINAGDVSSPIAAEVTGIGKRAAEEKARIDKENEEKARRAAAEARFQHNSICENLDGVDSYWVDTANKKLSILPESLIDAFRADGWHYYCTTMNLDAVYYGSMYGGVMGTTNYDEHRILVEDRTDAMDTAVIHEMGHWYDWHLGMITETNEFMNLYYSEESTFKYTFTVHLHYDSTELFAEAFWRFYTDNETLAANCPKLYALMSRVCPAPDD